MAPQAQQAPQAWVSWPAISLQDASPLQGSPKDWIVPDDPRATFKVLFSGVHDVLEPCTARIAWLARKRRPPLRRVESSLLV
jgi:hypothetical protein